ncbi:helix-turn-helix transcriptional regulator [Actinomadura sp. ATCC 31491]|uniref:Helix-turn-helix transcriptional regulator n=1 Tax=Actinomadura luzonensis TaxID=2805427 RepID=A0ABT0G3F0_9ACTN|nr:helix-turn-helix transcriptional regulator [Actinomadura luzonensis]MCK2219131.1 helix-turn-helix transcriptional regulator [Actinomadura luzonensis]
MSDNELGAYLRARREAVRPSDVGLPDGPRRRTPGLRRSELATLAGVSVEYLTRLEQGRDRHPSMQVLGALGDALRMTPEERVHLRNLAKISSGAYAMCPSAEQFPARTVRAGVRAVLDRLEPTPAALLNRLGEVVAHTAGFGRLYGPLGLPAAGDPPNLHRYVFTDVRARIAYPEWDRVADEHAAALRLEAGQGDRFAAELAEELEFAAGEAFAERMARPPAPPRPAPVQRLAHPEAGELRLAREWLDVDGGEQRLVVFLPADAATAAALERLAGRRPGALRAVTA